MTVYIYCQYEKDSVQLAPVEDHALTVCFTQRNIICPISWNVLGSDPNLPPIPIDACHPAAIRPGCARNPANFWKILDSNTVTVYDIGMEESIDALTVEELAERSETPVRTIRYYIGEGLLPKPTGRGRAAAYTADHLQRLQLIRRLVAQRVPLHEIRNQTAGLSSDDLGSLLADTRSRQEEMSSARISSPKDYLTALLDRAREGRLPTGSSPALRRELWNRYELAPGVELHVSRSADESGRRLVEALLKTVSQEGRNGKA